MIIFSIGSSRNSHACQYCPAPVGSYFCISERGTTLGTEIKAGLITFLTASYILLVNPHILGQAGAPRAIAVAMAARESVPGCRAGGCSWRRGGAAWRGLDSCGGGLRLGLTRSNRINLEVIGCAWVAFPGACRLLFSVLHRRPALRSNTHPYTCAKISPLCRRPACGRGGILHCALCSGGLPHLRRGWQPAGVRLARHGPQRLLHL